MKSLKQVGMLEGHEDKGELAVFVDNVPDDWHDEVHLAELTDGAIRRELKIPHGDPTPRFVVTKRTMIDMGYE